MLVATVFALQRIGTGNMFSHHQKTVILDAPVCSATTKAATAAAEGTHGPATLESLGTPKAADHPKATDFSGQRRVVAFVGGLDLTDGRYDRHDHPLFETLVPGGVHAEDHYQPCIDGGWVGGWGPWRLPRLACLAAASDHGGRCHILCMHVVLRGIRKGANDFEDWALL